MLVVACKVKIRSCTFVCTDNKHRATVTATHGYFTEFVCISCPYEKVALTGLVHLGLGLQTKKDVLQGCHGNTVVDDAQVFLIVELRKQTCVKGKGAETSSLWC